MEVVSGGVCVFVGDTSVIPCIVVLKVISELVALGTVDTISTSVDVMEGSVDSLVTMLVDPYDVPPSVVVDVSKNKVLDGVSAVDVGTVPGRVASLTEVTSDEMVDKV